ncbi:MAG: UDP-N-acetylmuramoyl-L-alanyl-D-glutamate--2,6-diaminopimelate ligase, partial [Desulfovibrio sp.]|nr:UDP-N-acetylmuramoyl-L-alanyl-D-glutamate--2,6-diaminopimelate ligase [Desulfovibrio sp.]
MSRTYEQVVAMVREGTPVSADSRSVAPGGVFVAVKGATEDGTRYVPAALEAGARTVVAA